MMLELYELAGAEPDRLFSPYCWRARMALAHKGLSAKTIPWRFTEKEALARSGQGLVPVLVVDRDRWIADSWVIAEYLEESHANRPSLFGGAPGRALSRFYNNWTNMVLQPGLIRFVALDVLNHLHEKDKAYFRQSREQRFGQTLESFVADRDRHLGPFRQSLAPLRSTLQAQRFLGGENPLYADYIVFSAFQWVRCTSDYRVLADDDPIASWRGRMLDLFDGMAGKAKGYPL